MSFNADNGKTSAHGTDSGALNEDIVLAEELIERQKQVREASRKRKVDERNRKRKASEMLSRTNDENDVGSIHDSFAKSDKTLQQLVSVAEKMATSSSVDSLNSDLRSKNFNQIQAAIGLQNNPDADSAKKAREFLLSMMLSSD